MNDCEVLSIQHCNVRGQMGVGNLMSGLSHSSDRFANGDSIRDVKLGVRGHHGIHFRVRVGVRKFGRAGEFLSS